MTWLRSVLAKLGVADLKGQKRVIPADPGHRQTLQRADTLLADPRVKKMVADYRRKDGLLHR